MPYRRSTRLKDYDYSQAGGYFITICTCNNIFLFGRIVQGKMNLSELGRIVEEEWFISAEIRPEIQQDAFVIMPNHIHGIAVITDINCDGAMKERAHGRAPLRRVPRSLGSFVAGFKGATTRRINVLRKTPGASVWQRNYYEHVIRNEKDLNEIREYIQNNPLQWALDEENPDRKL